MRSWAPSLGVQRISTISGLARSTLSTPEHGTKRRVAAMSLQFQPKRDTRQGTLCQRRHYAHRGYFSPSFAHRALFRIMAFLAAGGSWSNSPRLPFAITQRVQSASMARPAYMYIHVHVKHDDLLYYDFPAPSIHCTCTCTY